MTGLAVLPMYDFPEVRAHTDRLWQALAAALRAEGIAAPDRLDRGRPAPEAWTDPGLVLGQTCGLPFARHLAGRVRLVGAPDYALPGCPPGHYCSVLVRRSDDARRKLAEFEGATAAVNDPGSQSGYAALMTATAPYARDGRFFGDAVMTGAHRTSAHAVAGGGADLAALDAQTWRLICRHDPVAARLAELARTAPVPALPFITGLPDPGPVARAVASAIAGLDATTRAALDLHGFVPLGPEAYAPLPDRLAAAEAEHTLPGHD